MSRPPSLPRILAHPINVDGTGRDRDRICTLIGQNSSISVRADQVIGRLRPKTFNLDALDPASTSEVGSGVGKHDPFRALRFTLRDDDANRNEGSEVIGAEFDGISTG